MRGLPVARRLTRGRGRSPAPAADDIKCTLDLKVTLAEKKAELLAKDNAHVMFVMGLDRGLGNRSYTPSSTSSGTPGS